MDARRSPVGLATWLLGAVLAFALMLAVVVGVVLVAALVHSFWPEALGGGRDPRPAAAVAAVILAVLAFFLARRPGLSSGQLWAALGLAELALVAVLVATTGSSRPDRLLVTWFLGLSAYLALPWTVGLALGRWRRATVVPRSRDRG